MLRRYSQNNTRPYRAQQIAILLMHSAEEHCILTYKEVGEYIGYKGSGVLAHTLDFIHHWCIVHNLPALTSIVVNKVTGEPGIGLTLRVPNFAAEQRKVFAYDWSDIIPPSPDDLAEAFAIDIG